MLGRACAEGFKGQEKHFLPIFGQTKNYVSYPNGK